MDTSSHQRFVYDIFHNTWLDFYYWEQGDYHRTLDALGSPIIINKPTVLPQWIRPRAGLVHEVQDTPGVRESSLLQTEAVVSKLPSDEIEITEYQMTDGVATRLQADFAFTSVALRMPQAIFPSPQYEACAPLDQNIYLGDDSSDMPFLPFADDPSFSDWKSHSDEYETLSWQNMIRDPNLEAIVTTTWNSCIHHGLTPEIVAEVLSGMLPAPEVLKHKRDFCTWNHPLLGPIKPSNTALGGTVMTQDFCRLCELAYCSSFHETSPPVRSFIPYNTLGQKLDFCSESCFLNSPTIDIATMAWTEEKENQIADLLSFLPDTTPCYLAKICRKPCMEVFSYRERLLPNQPSTKRSKRQPSKKLNFLDGNPAGEEFVPTIFTMLDEKNWQPVSPCSHEGPCTEQSNCPCNISGAHCTSKCLCDQKCLRRWKGCKCAEATGCASKRCPCVSKKRECDPEVCVKSHSTTDSNTCGNVQIQMGQAKRTSVRQSQWGFGLFMEESVQKDELIDEYIGEVVLKATSSSRENSAIHRGRSYLFTLNKDFSIDSAYAGNATRYINHSDIPNCEAKILLVDGLQRIGVMASRDIDAGEELFLNYGDKFFIHNNQTSDPSTLPLSLNEDDENESELRLMEDIEYMAYTTGQFVMNDDPEDETYDEDGSGSGSGSS